MNHVIENNFIKDLRSQEDYDKSPLRKQIATIILKERNTHTAAERILQKVETLARQRGATEIARILNCPSADILSATNNVIFYNAKSVTINPNAKNTPSKSPRTISGLVLEEISKNLEEGLKVNGQAITS